MEVDNTVSLVNCRRVPWIEDMPTSEMLDFQENIAVGAG
jgi:hypothetical protein